MLWVILSAITRPLPPPLHPFLGSPWDNKMTFTLTDCFSSMINTGHRESPPLEWRRGRGGGLFNDAGRKGWQDRRASVKDKMITRQVSEGRKEGRGRQNNLILFPLMLLHYSPSERRRKSLLRKPPSQLINNSLHVEDGGCKEGGEDCQQRWRVGEAFGTVKGMLRKRRKENWDWGIGKERKKAPTTNGRFRYTVENTLICSEDEMLLQFWVSLVADGWSMDATVTPSKTTGCCFCILLYMDFAN